MHGNNARLKLDEIGLSTILVKVFLKKKTPLDRFDPGTPAPNALDITTTLQYLLT